MPPARSVFRSRYDVAVRRLTAADYRRMPWRNGGGVTTEIALAPGPGERFLWRVSIADVASDGPFSRFDGYDRHIVVLDGAGMTLDCGANGRLELRPLAPRSFSGDWDVTGTLVAGPVRDFNVIVDRALASATLSVREVSSAEPIDVGPRETCLLHVLAGDVGVASTGETIVADASFRIEPHAPARVIVVHVRA